MPLHHVKQRRDIATGTGATPSSNPKNPGKTSFLPDKFSSLQPPSDDGGARRDRTDDLLNANQALSQLSYGPSKMVGLGRLELPTSRLSSARSNQLSYKPVSSPSVAASVLAPKTPLLSKPVPTAKLVREERETKTTASRIVKPEGFLFLKQSKKPLARGLNDRP